MQVRLLNVSHFDYFSERNDPPPNSTFQVLLGSQNVLMVAIPVVDYSVHTQR